MNKQQYLAARLQWTQDYYALQQRIRAAKQALRDAHRAHGRCAPYIYKSDEAAKESNSKLYNAMKGITAALEERAAARKAMTVHLCELESLKAKARKAWEAREAAMS